MAKKKSLAEKSREIVIEQKYMEEAIRLAQNYSNNKKIRQFQDELRAGKVLYTREMAIADLTGGAIDYGAERVQTSNISNIPERVAIKLSEGYVEKMNARMVRESMLGAEEYLKLCEDIEIVNTAGKRMQPFDRAVFTGLFLQKLTFRQLIDQCPRVISNMTICRARDRALEVLAKEVMLREYCKEEYTDE